MCKLSALNDVALKFYSATFSKHIVFLAVQSSPVVVGVFGIGHCNGIKENFPNQITSEQMEEIQR